VGKNIPERKQVASLEFFETNQLEDYRQQISKEFKNLILTID
jgi:hypothetical protein